MAKFDYDLLVIGGGSAGLTASKVAVGFGKKVAIIEKNKPGGECTWSGCVPSKALIKAAQLANCSKKQKELGLDLSSEASAKGDGAKVLEFVRKTVNKIYQTHTPEQLAKAGVQVMIGSPYFVDNHHVMLNGKKLSAKKFIIATGSSPFVPPIDGLQNVSFLTNQNFFELKTLPSSILILGGGPIGSELSCALNRLGVKVTVIEMNQRILPREDQELVSILQKQFQHEGIILKTSMRALKADAYGNEVELTCAPTSEFSGESDGDVKFTLRADACLVATGRKPNVDGLELEKAGVAVEKRGIKVDKNLRTTAKNIYACGDVVGPYQFSHVAWYQAIVATRNALIPIFKKRVNYEHVLWITFTAPELASAGLTEQQARERFGSGIKVYRSSYGDIDRGVIDGASIGMGKFVCDKKGRLVGAHILGERAGELIHEAQLCKSLGVKFAKIGTVLHAYPAYSDLIWKAAKQARIEELKNNFFVKLYKRFNPSGGRHSG